MAACVAILPNIPKTIADILLFFKSSFLASVTSVFWRDYTVRPELCGSPRLKHGARGGGGGRQMQSLLERVEECRLIAHAEHAVDAFYPKIRVAEHDRSFDVAVVVRQCLCQGDIAEHDALREPAADLAGIRGPDGRCRSILVFHRLTGG